MYQITLITIIIFLEQKSIIRSIDTSITFAGIILLYFLLYDFFMLIRKKNIGIVAFLFSFLILFFIIYFGLGFKIYTPAYKTECNISDTQCVRRNLTEFLRFKQEYKKITEYILHITN